VELFKVLILPSSSESLMERL